MKVVAICVLVFLAVFARAQDNLQYEQAAYADNAAVAAEDEQPTEQFESQEAEVAEGEEEADEAAFIEDTPGPLSIRAHASVDGIKSLKDLVNSRKSFGFTISNKAKPAPKPVAAPAKKPLRPVLPVRRPGRRPVARPVPRPLRKPRKPLKKPIIRLPVRRPRPSKRPARRPTRRPLATPRPRGPIDNLWHYERHIPKNSEDRDPEMQKLNLALEAVKEDILSTNKQINEERRWVIAVSKIISSYNSKMKRVEAHIIALRKEMKNLYRKKKQIENLKLQKALEAKLKEARAELATLTNSLKHVAVKNAELNKSGRDLRMTIAGIQGQLAKLRGQQLHKAKKCRWGRKYNLAARKCTRICKKGQRLSKKTKKCVARKCKKGKKWDKKGKKCVKKSKKGKKSKKF